MPGLFNRLKVWSAGEVLKYSDLNGEFDNILANMEADNVAGWSSSVAQMRIQTNPGSVGSESLAQSVSGELERIRFVISRIIGKTYWYDTPDASLRVLSKKSKQGFFSSDASLAESWYQIVKNLGDPSSTPSFISGKFSTYAFENKAASSNFVYGNKGQVRQDASTTSLWYQNLQINDGVLYNPLIGAYLYVNSSGRLQVDFETSTSNANSDGKITQSVTGTSSVTGDVNWNNVILRYKVGGTPGTDAVDLRINGSSVGTPITSGTIPVNVGNGAGRWCYFAKKSIPTYTKYSAMGVVPNSDPSSPWTLTNSGTSSATVSGGVLTYSCNSGANTRYYSLSTFPSTLAAPVRIVTKVKITESGRGFTWGSAATGDFVKTGMALGFRLGGLGGTANSLYCNIDKFGISAWGASGVDIGGLQPHSYAHDFSEWTQLEIVIYTVAAVNRATFIINGKPAFNMVLRSDATAGSTIFFGKSSSTAASSQVGFQMEYIGFQTLSAGQFQTIVGNTTAASQAISDIVVLDDYQTDSTTLNALATASPESSFPLKRENVTESFSFSKRVNDAAGSGVGVVNDNSVLFSFSSDGITPVRIFATLNARNTSNATPFTYAPYFVLAITSNKYSDGSTVGSQPGLTSTTQQPIQLGDWHEIAMAANTVATFKLVINDVRVWPAGFYLFNPVYGQGANSTGGFIAFEQVTISVSK